jgi:Yip1-like protein
MALVDRVKNILLNPKQEWPVIDAEPTVPVDLYKQYIMPLAAIGPVAGMIGSTVFGYRIPLMGTIRAPIGQALSAMVVTYLLTLGGVYILALIIDALAPNFHGTKNQVQALKVAAYSSTASWVAGIFSLVPGLRWLGILGLYSLYLLYLGLPVLMKAPEDRAIAYTILVILAALVLFLVIGLVAGSFMAGPVM